MAKLYPPIIEGTLPAFYSTEEDGTTGIVKLVVPFSMNKSVPFKNVKGIYLKVKNISSNVYVFTKKIFDNFTDTLAIFDLSIDETKSWLNLGLSYKILIAYIDKTDTVGYYSTVGIGKYTSEATLEIIDLEPEKDNRHLYIYKGSYCLSKDLTEKVYSYWFNIYNSNKLLIATSGEQLHNIDDYVSPVEVETVTITDENNNEITKTEVLIKDFLYSTDTFEYNYDLIKGQTYYIEYCVKTLNNAIFSSTQYKIVLQESINSYLEADIYATTNREEGYIELRLAGHKDTDGAEKVAAGNFKIVRSGEDDNFTYWLELFDFTLINQRPSLVSFKDYLIELGKTYRYAILEYNNYGIVSNRKIYCDAIADFEHAYLSDGKRQLKIKYNPKVASFKEVLLEQKINTIGSKYPFIFRNGNVGYKEFTISGLISCLLDENYLFMDESKFEKFDYTSNLVSGNIYTERQFKLEVLNWLNDGKPKLFRSPTEGNYIVRLMNTSLSPNDTLGRMIHTFSTTATEIADYNYTNLLKYNILFVDSKEFKSLLQETVDLSVLEGDILRAPATSIIIEDAQEGAVFTIDDENITIDATGRKEIPLTSNKIILNIVTSEKKGLVTYTYYPILSTDFSKIKEIDFGHSSFTSSNTKEKNIYSKLTKMSPPSDGYYKIVNGEPVVPEVLDDECLWYKAGSIQKQRQPIIFNYIKATKLSTGSSYIFTLNGEEIDIKNSNSYFVSDFDNLRSLDIEGDGVLIELEYEYNQITYE